MELVLDILTPAVLLGVASHWYVWRGDMVARLRHIDSQVSNHIPTKLQELDERLRSVERDVAVLKSKV